MIKEIKKMPAVLRRCVSVIWTAFFMLSLVYQNVIPAPVLGYMREIA